jgi:hypothetical protein
VMGDVALDRLDEFGDAAETGPPDPFGRDGRPEGGQGRERNGRRSETTATGAQSGRIVKPKEPCVAASACERRRLQGNHRHRGRIQTGYTNR